MTANELADWIENGAPFGDYETAKQAATMLRQQQAEIERLIMLCDCMTTESNRRGNEIEELKALVISLSPNANILYTKASEK